MTKSGICLAVVGATGLVGRTMLQVTAERQLPIAELFPIASPHSRGLKFSFANREFAVSALEDELWKQADFALLSPGAAVSREWAPRLAEANVICIDNSSAWRAEPEIPLVVPEVNPHAIQQQDRLIANPNCSTIQLVVVLAPLHRAFGLQEVVVATYQSASGAGQKGKTQLLDEGAGRSPAVAAFPHQLFDNLIPAIGALQTGDYFSEEWKLVHETRKILELPELRVFPAVVRVPITHCHAEAVHLTCSQEVTPAQARETLRQAPGVIVLDDPAQHRYPLPIHCAGKDEVFVGRIRQLPGASRTLDFWIVADNLRKGAATNAVQILELFLKSSV